MDNNQIKITIGPERCWGATPQEAEALTELLDDMAILTQADLNERLGCPKTAENLRRLVLGPEPQESQCPRVAELEAENTKLRRMEAITKACNNVNIDSNRLLREKLAKADTYIAELEKDLDKARRAAEFAPPIKPDDRKLIEQNVRLHKKVGELEAALTNVNRIAVARTRERDEARTCAVRYRNHACMCSDVETVIKNRLPWE